MGLKLENSQDRQVAGFFGLITAHDSLLLTSPTRVEKIS
jgi:hypothetical protein